ncbi:hypothetical protein CK203_109034 [Vitis vinifera]|uniref:Uncharacterized protein n=1 Tax=Vitis vinifera TaxID=29760 RepID=A0A438EH99_VITVI|nr:hypothetical protein CK203_109034 [Vitis vinifera]
MVENLEELAFVLGCRVGVLSTSYLGLPLGAPHNSLTAWDGVTMANKFQSLKVMSPLRHLVAAVQMPP